MGGGTVKTKPWGTIYYLWCRIVHRNGTWQHLHTAGSIYRCADCHKQHYFKELKP